MTHAPYGRSRYAFVTRHSVPTRYTFRMENEPRMQPPRPLTSLFTAALLSASSLLAADNAHVTSSLTPEGGRIVVEAQGMPAPVPVFFSATAEHALKLGAAEITGEIRLRLRVVQGRPEVLTLGLSGDGEIVEVTGRGLRDWSVRQGTGDAAGRRFLDLRPIAVAPAGAKGAASTPAELDLVVRTRVRQPAVPGSSAVLLLAPGDAVGFASRVRLISDGSLDLRVTAASGMVAVGGETLARTGIHEFVASGEGRIVVALARRGAAPGEVDLSGLQLSGRVNEVTRTVEFRLRGQARALKPGVRVRVLEGPAALSERAVGDGWHAELVRLADDEGFATDLVFGREGPVTLDLGFATAIEEKGDWLRIGFGMPAGAVVPVRLEGLDAAVEFDRAAAVVPTSTAQGWQGFLPAGGDATLAWKRTRDDREGALFFTSTEETDVRVGAGLLRQLSKVTVRVLQGKLTGLRLRIDGPGEILGVDGANIVGWKVLPTEPGRVLEVRLSRPMEGEGAFVVRSQAALGNFPVRAWPLHLTPEGTVRHAGMARVANSGAVRLEVAEIEGLLQLAPAQFSGAAPEAGVRQVFVYRFPSEQFNYVVLASQIQPEVNVSQVITYELAETDRILLADLELDIREAPLRDWSLCVPEDYAVVSVAGAEVADHALESEARDGRRVLKVIFGKAVEGRQLLRLRLEKNQAAAAGAWMLPALQFPGAKSVRGHIGAVAAAGYRMVPVAGQETGPGAVAGLVEVPLSYFPRQTNGLQQAWRLREPDWSAAVAIEALGQSVQADVFHLYSLKEGLVHGSVLLNYFVVGAPASEWRLEIPETAGNIDVVGQNVRRDWRREGNQIVVTLHQPVLGAATLLVTFEQPMSARGGAVRPGEVRPIGVQAERGYVQVVSPLQVKHEVRAATGGLLRLEPLELPTELRLLTSSPSLAVFQYTGRPFALEMGVEWYEQGETVDQVVDFAKLSSQVARDGQVVTEARFFVKTRGRKALRLVLPEGVRLWEARVDREVVTARADGGQTLVPLPARMNPNEPVEVALRLGQPAIGSGRRVELAAPRLLVPTVINEWLVRGDPERVLVPEGGTAGLAAAVLPPTGFEWIAHRARTGFAWLLSAMTLGGILLRARSGWRVPAGLVCGACGIFVALVLALHAAGGSYPVVRELSFASAVVPAGQEVSIRLANLTPGQALVSWWGVAVGGAGLVALVAALVQAWRGAHGARLLVAVGVALAFGGLLAQRELIAYVFGGVGAALVVVLVVLGVLRLRRGRAGDPGAAPAAGAATLALAVLLGLAGTGRPAQAQDDDASVVSGKPALAMVQTWSLRQDRLFAEVEVTVRGAVGESFEILREPAVLTEFKGDGLRVGKIVRGGTAVYVVAPEREGLLTARFRYEMAVKLRDEPIALATGSAAMQRVTIDLDEGGWEFVSDAAVQIVPTPGLPEARSGATLVLAAMDETEIAVRPRRRDIAAETTSFFAELATLYLPGPGVVNASTRLTIRPAQGRVSALELIVPAGFTVGEVVRGPVGAWRFDPEKHRLHVAIEPAQAGAFVFDVEMQRGAGALPVGLELEPLRVVGPAGEVGMLALAFGGDAQPESVRASGLSSVSTGDFDARLLPRSKEGQPLAMLQHVWRYGSEEARVALQVAPVAPEIRVNGRQVFSLDDDRLVIAAELAVSITRVGLFKLSFVLPDGLEVESLSGAALSHWTEATEGGVRVVTLHLNGRTIGEQAFSLSLAGAAPRAQDAWPVPRLVVREATRQTGELLLVPGKGIRLRVADRGSVTQLDPRAAGGLQPGTLAFRLLQDDWSLAVGIESLEPWVTVQALQEVTLREGQTLTRIAARHRVENAAIKHVRVRLPGLGEDQVRTVRATGAAVSDFVRVPGEADLWEVRFQRGIVGDADVLIEFQGQAAGERGSEPVVTPQFVGARQVVQFVAVRSGGRLELEAGEVPRGWQRVDWSAVPVVLQDRNERGMPVLCFRVAEPEAPLQVAVRRHEVAGALKLRVTDARLTTLFSPEGSSLTAVALKVDVLEKGTLEVRLPAGARLFNTLVNGESVAAVREADAYRFHVFATAEENRSAEVRLVYAADSRPGGRVALTGPGLNVPLENVAWDVVIPRGWQLDSYSGELRLRESAAGGVWGIDDYVSSVSKIRSAESKKAAALLEEASRLVQKGEQQQAGELLTRVSNASALDEASNEDARIQLRALKTDQAMMSLNTRRQRLYLDNRGDGARNEQLEQAASLNPYMQGRANFDPQQLDQLLMGNTAEENSALRGIASRIVDQQLASEPAPGAIDVTLPTQGRVLSFTRSLQVDGGAPLGLGLVVSRRDAVSWSNIVLILAGIAVVALLVAPAARAKSGTI